MCNLLLSPVSILIQIVLEAVVRVRMGFIYWQSASKLDNIAKLYLISQFPPPNKLTLDPIGTAAPEWPERYECDSFEPAAALKLYASLAKRRTQEREAGGCLRWHEARSVRHDSLVVCVQTFANRSKNTHFIHILYPRALVRLVSFFLMCLVLVLVEFRKARPSFRLGEIKKVSSVALLDLLILP